MLWLCVRFPQLPQGMLGGEGRQLQQLALWGYRFSPDISLHPPDCLLLEVSSCLRLFKGFTRLYRGLARGFTRRDIEAHFGLAHTPLAAQLLSYQNAPVETLLTADDRLRRQAVNDLLNALPLSLLPVETKAQEKLRAMGLHTLGEVRKLPQAALRKRLGAELVRVLARIDGSEADVRTRFAPPDTFFSERCFNGVIDSTGQLRFPMAALLGELEHYLRIKQWINRQLDWHFHYSDGGSDVLSMPISHSHFRRRSLLDLVMLRLERFTLKAPVDAIALHCERFEALEHRSDDLFSLPGLSPAAQQERYSAVLDKLAARLGADCCFTPAIQREHLPEKAWAMQSPLQVGKTMRARPARSAGLRPLWLMAAPRPVSECEGGLYWHGVLELLQGPERIDNGWWQQRQARDYYIARREDGGLYWLYRDVLQRKWYVQGVFG